MDMASHLLGVASNFKRLFSTSSLIWAQSKKAGACNGEGGLSQASFLAH